MKMARNGLTLALAAVLVLGSQIVIPQASFAAGQSAQTDTNIQADLQNQLKKFKDVQVSVKNGVVDLEGTVKDFATKEEIDKKAHRIKNVAAVRNKLKIAGPAKSPTLSCNRRSYRSCNTIASAMATRLTPSV